MFDESQLPDHPGLAILGRVLFASLFVVSGVTHFTNVPYYLSLMPGWTPSPVALTLVSGVVELIGAGLILANRHARLGGWLLVLFMVPVTLLVHGHALLTETDPVLWAHQQAHFFKGVALTGAALLITQVGVSRTTVAR